MVCKGVCEKYKSTKPNLNNDGRYQTGQKRCTTCEIFIKWDGVSCPCCGVLLRNKARTSKLRKRLQEIEMAKKM